MDIIISNSSGRPIYEQIYNRIKDAIISGELSENEMLPSIRLLAKELRISVITTKRAYDNLENDGYIYSVVGKGSFVAAKNMELIKEQTLNEIEEHITAAYTLARRCEMNEEEFLSHVKIIIKEDLI